MSGDRVRVEKEPNRDLWFVVADGVRVGAVSNRKDAEVLASNARRRIELEEIGGSRDH